MTTQILLMRHAKPEDPNSQRYPNEGLRPLVEEGVQIQHQLMKNLLNKGIDIQHILCSPLTRAMQTADIVKFYYPKAKLSIENALGNTYNPDRLLQILMSANTDQTWALVGHDPTLLALAKKFCPDSRLPPGLSKSTALQLEFKQDIAYSSAHFINYHHP